MTTANHPQTYVDLTFRIVGHRLPADHGYALFASISHLVSDFHQAGDVAVHPIGGRQSGDRLLQLTSRSRLTLRLPTSQIERWLRLSGQTLGIAGAKIRIGAADVHLLRPAAVLRSRLTTIKLPELASASGDRAAQLFAQAVRRKLDGLGIRGSVRIDVGKRRTLRIRGREICGYEIVLSRLSPDESLWVQQDRACFSRRHMGCGIFVPFGPIPARPGAMQ